MRQSFASAPSPTDADVLVVGAGMAGLSAARALAQKSLRVLVLEARDRIGGRIYTKRVENEVIELGAEFVHGRPANLLALIEEAGLTLVERTGEWVRSHDGELIAEQDGTGAGVPESAGDPFALLEELKNHPGSDITFAAFLTEKDLSNEARESVIGYVEGFNAADHRIIGVAGLGLQQEAEDAIEGDRSFHISGGYDQLPAFLAARLEELGGQIRTATAVHRIKWQPGRIVGETNEGAFSAGRAILALPLGVLQSGKIHFDPPLPVSLQEVFSSNGPVRMGSAARLTMTFRKRFWAELQPKALEQLSFIISPATIPSVWWTTHPELSNTLTGWIGGPRAANVSGLSAEALGGKCCQVLAELFHLDVAHLRDLLTGCFTHDWEKDRHSMGAYSYIAKDGIDAPALLAKPVADTLYFAGEHTTTDGHWGTVHAALSSGLRAASQIDP